MARTPEQAIEWAQARVGAFGWDNLCLSFVRQSFGIDYVGNWPNDDRNAGTAWDRAQIKHRETNPTKIPRGVPVFFELATAADHVVLSLGNGRCISNDFVVDGRIDVVSIADIARRWGPLLGWTQDLVGNRVIPDQEDDMANSDEILSELKALRGEVKDLREQVNGLGDHLDERLDHFKDRDIRHQKALREDHRDLADE